ncbi:MAG: YceI family protein [Flavobacteriales bacterium]|nr:YceI family protein [Flavobacteriales bacterium]
MSKATWVIDPTHSNIGFKVKHLMISTVSGEFTKYAGTVTTEGDSFSGASVEFSAEVDSITTQNEQRDGHLKSADFFDAANHPSLTFKSTSFKKEDDDEFEMTGDLTLRGITRSVKLEVEFAGIVQDPYGNTKAGFSLKGKINRKDFGLTWSAVTEAGSIVVSDEIKLAMEVQLVKQA